MHIARLHLRDVYHECAHVILNNAMVSIEADHIVVWQGGRLFPCEEMLFDLCGDRVWCEGAFHCGVSNFKLEICKSSFQIMSSASGLILS